MEEKRPSLKHRLHLFQLEEEMGRQQDRNTLNSIKNNTAPRETSGSTKARSEHPNSEGAEENNLKNKFMKMIEALKEEMKIFLTEMEEKSKKNWKKSIKTRKSNQTGEKKQFKT